MRKTNQKTWKRRLRVKVNFELGKEDVRVNKTTLVKESLKKAVRVRKKKKKKKAGKCRLRKSQERWKINSKTCEDDPIVNKKDVNRGRFERGGEATRREERRAGIRRRVQATLKR